MPFDDTPDHGGNDPRHDPDKMQEAIGAVAQAVDMAAAKYGICSDCLGMNTMMMLAAAMVEDDPTAERVAFIFSHIGKALNVGVAVREIDSD